MTLQTSRYNRVSFPVEAVQVTPDNMQEVAKWCGGTILSDGEKEGHLSRDYIKVTSVNKPMNEKQTQAYLGDWVLKSYKTFKVYTNVAFLRSFTPAVDQNKTPITVNNTTLTVTPDQVFRAVKNAINAAGD